MNLDTLRAGVQDRMEGLILLCLGGFMALLARSPLYWSFLNPRFAPLTLCAGAGLCLCGLALLLRPESGRGTSARLLRQAAMLGFLCLATLAWERTADNLAPQAPSGAPSSFSAPADPGTASQAGPAQGPRVTRDGVEYVRLNLAELAIMLDKGRKDFPEHFVLRAHLTRPQGMDGQALLSRTAVVCCLADSLHLGFLAQGLDELSDGQWVEVYGHLAPLDAEGRKHAKAASTTRELSLRLVNPAQGIVAEHAQAIPTPDPPFLFEFREKEPFAWN